LFRNRVGSDFSVKNDKVLAFLVNNLPAGKKD